VRFIGRYFFIALLLVFSWTTICFASDEPAQKEPTELTLDNAISRAVRYSKSIEKAKIDINKAKDARVSVPASYYYNYVEGAETGIWASETTHFAYEKANKSYQTTYDSVILDVYENYYAILQKIEDVSLKTVALDKAKQDLNITKIFYNIGMGTTVAVYAAETNAAAKEADLSIAKVELDNAYASFNQLVSLDDGEYPVLVDRPEFKPIEEDRDACLRRVMDDSPMLWTAEEAAAYMSSVANMTPTVGSAVTDEDVDKSKLDAKSAKDATRLLVYNLYAAVKKMEEGHATLEQTVKLNEENLRIIKLKFDVGMATKTDVINSENELLQVQKQLFDLECQHAYMSKVLEKPWAYSSGTSNNS